MDQVKQNLQNEIEKLKQLIKQNTELSQNESDEEMKKMFADEAKKQQQQIESLQKSIEAIDNPESGGGDEDDDPNSHINTNIAILEIRNGTGGAEASLFAFDLYRMYMRYAERNKYRAKEISYSDSEVGGIKSATIELRGAGIYNKLVHESGVHRVQRVPKTESSGRIHTSTATVAVLPKLKKIEIEIKPDEIEEEFYHSSGKGGQNVNKVSTAVRLKHLPTGIVIECQQERTQLKNRNAAMEILKARLYTLMVEQRVKNISELRAEQVGSGERSEKIRTYNFPQDRVTDHRVKKTWHNISGIMDGDIENVLKKLGELSVDTSAAEEA